MLVYNLKKRPEITIGFLKCPVKSNILYFLQLILFFSFVVFMFYILKLLNISVCRTRESLASNTSSILESNRRQNLALSPGHIGITTGNGAPFSFRTIPEPAAAQTEKVQKPNNCLASITSV